MYAHVGTRTTPLCLARGDCSIVTRRDRFHLWSRMVMTPWRRSGERERVTGSHRSSGPRVQVGKPGSQGDRAGWGIAHRGYAYKFAYFRPASFDARPTWESTGSWATGAPLRSRSQNDELLTVSFVVLELEILLPRFTNSKSRIDVSMIARRQNYKIERYTQTKSTIRSKNGVGTCIKFSRLYYF